MKKTLLVVLVLAVLAAVGYYLVRTFAPTEFARYVPENTVAYLAITDTYRTAQRWKQTDIAKIAEEPAVRDFLQLPLEQLGKIGKNEAEEILMGLKPVRLFLAVTSIQPGNFSWLGGFQYYGGNKELQRSLDRLRLQLDNGRPATPHTVSQYEGVEVTVSNHGELSLYSAAKEHWCILSNSEKSLHEMLDRLAGRNTSPSLSANVDFLKGLTQLPKEPDMIGYVQIQPILDVLLTEGQRMGATPNTMQVEQLKKLKVVSASFKLDGALMRDSIFVQTTDEIAAQKLDHKTVKYTSPETLIYYSSITRWPNIATLFQNSAALPPDILMNLSEQQLDKVNLSDVFGPEFGFILSWPKTGFRPELLIAVPLVNAETAKKLTETISASMFPQMTITEDQDGRYYSFPSVQNPLLNPTIGITKNFLIAGMAESEVRVAASRPADAPTMEGSADFSGVKTAYSDANEAFGYIDTKAIFERGYIALKPVLSFSVAMLPNVGTYVDISKLPDAETVSRHLSPIVYSQRRLPTGIYLESYGPITLNQLFALSGGAGLYFMPKK